MTRQICEFEDNDRTMPSTRDHTTRRSHKLCKGLVWTLSPLVRICAVEYMIWSIQIPKPDIAPYDEGL